jgi:hypothetical protein
VLKNSTRTLRERSVRLRAKRYGEVPPKPDGEGGRAEAGARRAAVRSEPASEGQRANEE